MDYKDTLLMNKSNFEMRGNLPQKEPILVEQWKKDKVYEQMNINRENAKEFVLHDGPPYANGDIHCGHMLNRLLKDFCVRFMNMNGCKTPFVFGWDTHGLPIENMVTKSGVDRKTTPIVEFRKKCEEYALKQVEKQKEQIRRLGILGDFDRPYLTLMKEYEAAQVEVFATMALKGLIYKGLKPVYWSPSSESALAEAEIEYADVLAHSIYVAFDVRDGKNLLPKDAKLVIWTTTPWTLPANLAISAHPDFIYALYKTNKGNLVFLKEFESRLKDELELGDIELLKEFKGSELEFITCKHPFYDRDSLVIVGTHVTNESGTGLVHTAPGHGVEDYQVCLKYPNRGLDPYCPVDEHGRLKPGVGERLEGLFYEDANDVVLQILTENGALLKHSTFTHSYPHDWRTGKPLIFRATDQWFCSIDPIRDQLIDQIHKVHWHPRWGEARMVNMIKDRGDWCISRQRAWGVPIPILYCEDGTPIIEKEVFDRIIELFGKYGSNIWFEKEAKELLPEGYTNKHSPNGIFTKEKDIMDVWFDSGSSFNGVIKKRGITFPADMYYEGSDQYRGWFNSSLIVSVATQGVAPYKSVCSHGWVLDEKGQQMHKSKGNGVDPIKLCNTYGADVLRLWAALVDSNQDVRIGDNILKNVSEQYRKIRNTLKFISWNLVDFDVNNRATEFVFVDTYILGCLESIYNHLYEGYQTVNLSIATTELLQFISTDLSAFYFEISKDVLYCDAKDSLRRRQIQTVLYYVGEALLRILNPVLPFTMDEFNKNLPGKREKNVQFLDYVKSDRRAGPIAAAELGNKISRLRIDVLKALEEARNAKIIGSSQEALVTIQITNDKIKTAFLGVDEKRFKECFVVSGVKIVNELNEGNTYSVSKISVVHHPGHFCSRCWNYSDEAVEQEDGTYLCPRCQEVMKNYEK
ncbi:MAG: isoleucine--tRNA ligase [Bacilli bacterium]|nr:isoleucine--tRNA ligase [Bacilli bacterium]